MHRRYDPLSPSIEIKRLNELQFDLLSSLQRRMWIGQSHQCAIAILQVNVILIAEMLDPAHPPGKLTAVGLGDLQVLGAYAEGFGPRRHRGMRQQLSRQEIDRRGAESARHISICRS